MATFERARDRPYVYASGALRETPAVAADRAYSLGTGLLPDRVLRAHIAVTCCPGEQAALDVEAEQVIVRRRHRDAGTGSLGDEEFGQCLPGGRILNGMSTAGAVEGILIVLAGERVQRVPAVPVEIGLLGPWHDKGVQAALVDERAHRVHPRAAIAADRCQERQSHPELVQQRPSRLGQPRLGLLKLAPRDSHCPSLRTIGFHVNQPPAAPAVLMTAPTTGVRSCRKSVGWLSVEVLPARTHQVED